MTAEELDREWQDIISGKIPSNYTSEQNDWTPIHTWILDCIVKSSVEWPIILDVGCGLGHFERMANKVIGLACYSCDASQVAVDYAKKKSEYPSLIYRDDVSLYPEHLATPPTDIQRRMLMRPYIYVMTEVLEHIENDMDVLSAIPKDSHVYISLPIGGEHITSNGHVRSFNTIQEALDRYKNIIKITQWATLPPHFIAIKAIRT